MVLEQRTQTDNNVTIMLWEVGSIVPLKGHFLRFNLFSQKEGRFEQACYEMDPESFKELVSGQAIDFSNCGKNLVSIKEY